MAIFLLTLFSFSNLSSRDDILSNHLGTLEENLNLGEFSNENSQNIEDFAPFSSNIDSWWNENYNSRRQILITEPGSGDRTNSPFDLNINFNNETCFNSSIRITEMDGTTQTEIPSQVWNISFWQDSGSDSDFIENCIITFSVNILQDEIKTFYVYFSNTTKSDPAASYYATTQLTSSFTSGQLSVSNNKLLVELSELGAYDNLEILSGSGSGINYHTSTSMSPSSSIVEDLAQSTTLYSPNSQGYITDWLLAGGFYTQSNSRGGWAYSPTVYNISDGTTGIFDYVDPTIDYAVGSDTQIPTTDFADNAIAQGTRTWVEHNDADEVISLNEIYSPNDYLASYALTYVYFPTDTSGVNLFVGSDDGIRIYFDHQRIHENHILRGISVNDQDLIAIGDVKAGWHPLLIMVEEYTGGYSFKARFSSNPSTYTPISNLQFSLGPKTVITSIEIEESGPIFIKANIEWSVYDELVAEDMRVWESLWIYQGLNMYKSERTFWWDSDRTAGNNSFGVTNTMYPSHTITGVDQFVSDGALLDLTDLNENYTAQNYTFAYDYDPAINGGNNYLGQGIFITNAYNTSDTFLTEVNSTGFISSERPNLVVGSETDLENYGPHEAGYPAKASYNVTAEFWEMVEAELANTDPSQIGILLDRKYDILMNPLQFSVDTVEPLHYSLTLNLKDVDGNFAPGVKVTLYNTTADWSGIDNGFSPRILTTTETGIVSFSQLTYGNYSVNITYQAYNKDPIYLRTVNHTLDSSASIDVLNLNLTKLILNLKFLLKPEEAVIGANVSLFWNATNSQSEFFGSEISDTDGQVSFYCINQTEITGNYSVKIYSYGDFRPINDTQGIISKTINFTVASLTEKTISVQLADFKTNLETIINSPSSDLVNTHYWGQDLSIFVNYTYTSDSITHIGINGANVWIEISNVQGVLAYNGTLFTNGTDGIYGLEFNSSNINYGLNTDDTFNCYIFAEKTTYDSNIAYVSIKLLKQTAELVTVDVSDSSPYWNESTIIDVYYNDTLNNKPILDALVSYSVEALEGNLTEIGDGFYQLIFNTSDLVSVDEYTIIITSTAKHYESDSRVIEINVLAITTSLTPIETSITVNWNSNFSLGLEYFDTLNSQGLNTSEISWEVVGNTDIFGTVLFNESLGAGWYSTVINSSVFTYSGDYSIKVSTNLENYQALTIYISITVDNIPTEMRFNDGTPTSEYLRVSISINETDSVTFKFTYFNQMTGFEVINASIRFFTWDYTSGSGESGSAEVLVVDDYYQLDFDTSELIAGDYFMLITIGEVNYDQKQVVVLLTVEKRLFSYSLGGDLSLGQFYKERGYDWDLQVNLMDASRQFDSLLGASISLNFPSTSYNVILTDGDNDGIYDVVIDWSILDPVFTELSYQGILTITNDTFTAITLNITFILPYREMGLQFGGDFESNSTIAKKNGETFRFSITLKDISTNSPLLDATVLITFDDGKTSISLSDSNGDGIYIADRLFTSDEVSAFFRDSTFEGVLHIEAENYESISNFITIKVKMNEVIEGIPTFYLLLAIGAAIIVAVTVVSYRYVQYARIPAFVKLIDKVKKDIVKNHDVSDQNVSLSIHEEIVEKIADRWQLLDLDLSTILGKNSMNSSVDSNITTGDEEVGGL